MPINVISSSGCPALHVFLQAGAALETTRFLCVKHEIVPCNEGSQPNADHQPELSCPLSPLVTHQHHLSTPPHPSPPSTAPPTIGVPSSGISRGQVRDEPTNSQASTDHTAHTVAGEQCANWRPSGAGNDRSRIEPDPDRGGGVTHVTDGVTRAQTPL